MGWGRHSGFSAWQELDFRSGGYNLWERGEGEKALITDLKVVFRSSGAVDFSEIS
jgi:hypothetical protein